jgi:hypothetical protein
MVKNRLFACLVIILFLGQLQLKATVTITAAHNASKKAVAIQWQYNAVAPVIFIIERSSDNEHWVAIARQQTAPPSASKLFEYYDYTFSQGQNFYRLKYVVQNGIIQYSNTAIVGTGSSWVIYPVPVGDILTLRYKGNAKISGVVNVFIQNIYGKILTRIRSASINTIIRIPVANLGKGVYDIRIVLEGDVVWQQRFVK